MAIKLRLRSPTIISHPRAAVSPTNGVREPVAIIATPSSARQIIGSGLNALRAWNHDPSQNAANAPNTWAVSKGL
ncbi:hypothetical protein D3C79_1081830 [compost metagenome]